jgi:hypothetical protein
LAVQRWLKIVTDLAGEIGGRPAGVAPVNAEVGKFSGLTYWMVTLPGWRRRIGAASNPNKIATVRNRIGAFSYFEFPDNGLALILWRCQRWLVFDLIASAEQLGKMVCLFDNADGAPRYHHK